MECFRRCVYTVPTGPMTRLSTSLPAVKTDEPGVVRLVVHMHIPATETASFGKVSGGNHFQTTSR